MKEPNGLTDKALGKQKLLKAKGLSVKQYGLTNSDSLDNSL